jgi:hypothetical protein
MSGWVSVSFASRHNPAPSARRTVARVLARLLTPWRARPTRIRVSRLSDEWLKRHDADAMKHPPL